MKLHTDSVAAKSAQSINALAYTSGNNIVFNNGQYSPHTDAGKKLMVHELTHVVQQTNSAHRKIMRAVSDKDVEAEFNTWAASNGANPNKKDSAYAHDLWRFISLLIAKPDSEPKEKPTGAKELKEWNENLEKAGIIFKWLVALKKGTKDEDTKDAAESRASGILTVMAKAGLVSNAMSQAGELSDKNKGSLFEVILQNPALVSASQLETITAFQCANEEKPENVPVVKFFTQNISAFSTLDVSKAKSILKPLINKFRTRKEIIEFTATLLLFNNTVRNGISEAMMKKEIGEPDFLFQVLKHPFFVEPGYPGVETHPKAKPQDMSEKDYESKRMKDDMPWVYKYKQKYYVQYLIDLAAGQSLTIAPPSKMDATGLKNWLETNTQTIGEAAHKKFNGQPDQIFDIYQNIADIFFFHVPHDRNVVPDQKGSIKHLQPGEPARERFEADCDVFATYAMRLFNHAGFEPIGYLAYVPTGASSKRPAHVTALMREGGKYYIINNKGIIDAKVSDTKPNDKKAEAIDSMLVKSLNDAYDTKEPIEMKIYYADAEPGGRMSDLFFKQDSSLEKPALAKKINP